MIEGVSLTSTSPIAIWETVIATARLRDGDFDDAGGMVERYLSANNIRVIPITFEIGELAVDASRRFGRGRHPAALNFGDCFAYACARSQGVPLLFKGEDFAQTDIEPA